MKTYQFKLYSNHGNRELHKTIDGHVHVWNHCIALQRRYYAIYGKYISKFRLINHISKLKRLPKFAHWNQLPSQAIQDVASRIDKGYKAMFEARSNGLISVSKGILQVIEESAALIATKSILPIPDMIQTHLSFSNGV